MAKKQESAAIKGAVTREKNKGIVREEKHFLAFLIAIIILLLYLLWAQANGWWPFMQPKLGSAFYTNVSAAGPDKPSVDTTAGTSADTSNGNTSSGGTNGTNGSNGSNGASGSNGSNGSNGGTTTPPATSNTDGIADLAAVINVGSTKTEITSKANGLGTNCAVVVKAATAAVGQQEVCTYSQGDKIVTVTYLNDRVVSASKSGF